MRDMMHACWEWMMGFGWIGMFLGFVVLVLLIVLLIALIQRVSRPSP